MNCDVDVAVVGGGPAGAAAAIWAALSGLRVMLVEACRFPRHRPGEALHPGVEGPLRQLGVYERVAEACRVRHRTVRLDWAGRRSIESFGADENGDWSGYQILREELDRILLERALETGVEVMQPCAAGEPLIANGRVYGFRHAHGMTTARFVIDGSGPADWLGRRLGMRRTVASPPLRVAYGYCEGEIAPEMSDPCFRGDSTGWLWTARVAERRWQWTQLSLDGQPRTSPPREFSGLRAMGRTRYRDVTWRCAAAPAGHGYFIVGDAATVLDPSASHGVLRALMSGMMASYSVESVLLARLTEQQAYAAYRAWLGTWFARDVERLSALYREIAPHWPSIPLTGAR